jgi:hypothetical protein
LRFSLIWFFEIKTTNQIKLCGLIEKWSVQFTLYAIFCSFQFRLVQFKILFLYFVLMRSPLIICIILINLGKNRIEDTHDDLYTPLWKNMVKNLQFFHYLNIYSVGIKRILEKRDYNLCRFRIFGIQHSFLIGSTFLRLYKM